jgi:hypothetical protein
MTFFYNLNKKLDEIRATPELTHKQLNERDMSRAKYNKYDDKKDVEEGIGDMARKAAGAVGGAVNKVVDRLSGQAAQDAKYQERMNRTTEFQKARSAQGEQNRIDSRSQEQEFDRLQGKNEGMGDMARKVGGMVKKVANKAMDTVGHGSDADMIRDLQKKMGMPQTGMKPGAEPNPKQVKEGEAEDKLLAAKIRKMLPAYHKRMEPEDAYQEVADALGISVERLYDVLEVNEGAAPMSARKVKEGEGTIDAILRKHAKAVKDFKNGADLDYDLESDLYDYYFNQGDIRNYDADASEYVAGRLADELGLAESNFDKKKISTGTVYSRKYDADSGETTGTKRTDNDAKRGRGRPKKDADSDGEVMKPDWSAFGVGKVNLPKDKTARKIKGRDTVDEEQIEEGKQERIQKARDLIDRACGLDACSPEELGDHRIDMIAQETGLKRGHVKSIANHMDDEDDIKESATRELTDADNKVLAMVKKQIREMEQALTTASSEDSRYYKDRLSDLHDMVKMIHGEEPLGLDTDVMDEVSDMYRSIGASMYESGPRVKESSITEKAVSKAQQQAAGIALAAKRKGEKPAGKGASAEMAKMSTKDLEDFAATKHKGLPVKKKKDEAVEETTVSGSVAPAAGENKSGGGYNFGGGIYDSMNRDLEDMISESMARLDESLNINMSMNNDDHGGPRRSLTVTATDDDAEKLGMLMKMAGLGTDYSADMPEEELEQPMEENEPDYPTNTVTSDDAFQYSGGLNKPKRDVAGDGQATGQVTAVSSVDHDNNEDLDRMMEMAGVKKKEVEEEKTAEGNKFTGNLAKARAAGKTQADLDGDGDLEKVKESILDLSRLWKAYKG